MQEKEIEKLLNSLSNLTSYLVCSVRLFISKHDNTMAMHIIASWMNYLLINLPTCSYYYNMPTSFSGKLVHKNNVVFSQMDLLQLKLNAGLLCSIVFNLSLLYAIILYFTLNCTTSFYSLFYLILILSPPLHNSF